MSIKRGVVLHGRSREIVFNVYKFFESEKLRAHELLKEMYVASVQATSDGKIPLPGKLFVIIQDFLKGSAKITERVSTSTGINKNTITKIKREGIQAEAVGKSKIPTPKKKARGKAVVLDKFNLSALNQMIQTFYLEHKEMPSLNKIYLKAQDSLNFQGSKTTLLRIMKNQLGYKFKKCSDNRSRLIERPNIKAWRAKYLRRIRENDALGTNKKPVIYVQTWNLSHNSLSKYRQSSDHVGVPKTSAAGLRWNIAHAGAENGFIDGAFLMFEAKSKPGYQEHMNSETFTMWLNHQLLPNIPENCLVVIDDAPCNKPPNMGHKKCEIQAWLNDKGIIFDPSLSKSELNMLVQNNKPPRNHEIYNLFATRGHEVLRLPPNSCELNPIEYTWGLIKNKVSAQTKAQLSSEIERLTQEAMHSITANEWKTEFNNVKNIEQQYFEIQKLEDNDEFSFIFHTGKFILCNRNLLNNLKIIKNK